MPLSRGNLFHAVQRFNRPELLSGSSKLFEKMELCWIFQSAFMLPGDFVFRSVVFKSWSESIIHGIPPGTFDGKCQYL
jgi:hypothetical protein